jgi:IMP dehydrogenase
VDDRFGLRGLITAKDFQKAKDYPIASKDSRGALRVGAALGTGVDTVERVDALVQAGVDVVVVDTAHGFTKGVLDRVQAIKSDYPDLDVVGGNIVDGDAAEALVKPAPMASKSVSDPVPSVPRVSSPVSEYRRFPRLPGSPRSWRNTMSR